MNEQKSKGNKCEGGGGEEEGKGKGGYDLKQENSERNTRIK